MSVLVTCLFPCINAFGASDNAAVDPPHWKEATIALVIATVIILICFVFWYQIVMRSTKRHNIKKLMGLGRELFNSFNNLIEKDGLFEEAWSFISDGDEERDTKFQGMMTKARDIVRQESMKKTLEIFEQEAKDFLTSRKIIPIREISLCEMAGFSRITTLIGTKYAKMEFLELVSLLYLSSQLCSRVVGHDLAFRFIANRICLDDFRLQIEGNTKMVLSSGPREDQGMLEIINDTALFIYAEGCREKIV